MMRLVLRLSLILLIASISAAERPVLRILSWSDYLDPQLAAEFGRRQGVKIEEVYFDSDTERDRVLAASGAAGFDLAMVDAAQIPVYRDRGWIAPIGESRVPGLGAMETRWRNTTDGAMTHAFPFSWGTVGIAYRVDLLKQPPRSWLTLFEPTAAVCGKLTVFSDARELVGSALKATLQPANADDATAYARAEQLLKSQRPCVAKYQTSGSEADSDLVTGKVWLAMSYNSDAAMLHAFEPRIRFMLPPEGGLVWVDYLTVLSSSQQKSAAYAFLKFLSEPGIAARQTRYSQAATPNRHALQQLPAQLRTDPVMYPSGAALAASEVIVKSTPAIMAMRNQIQAKIVRKP
jgi:spermidine/putrescine transport system substrate-binding protein